MSVYAAQLYNAHVLTSPFPWSHDVSWCPAEISTTLWAMVAWNWLLGSIKLSSWFVAALSVPCLAI